MKKVINMIDSSSRVAGVSLLQLKKAEKELGALFPEEYKELFLESNGAKFGDWTLYPIQSEASNDIVKQNNENQPRDLHEDVILIGENTNGDKLCYRIRKRFMQEQIYIWNEKSGLSDCKALTLSTFIDWYVPNINPNKPAIVGSFTVESGQLIVSDPCYQDEEDIEMQVVLSHVKKGKWTASISYNDEAVVKNLFVYYGDKKPTGQWHDCENMIGVDSAQAGVFDSAFFGKDEAVPYEVKNVYSIEMDEPGLKYYVACCDVSASDAQGGVVPGGGVAMSGYGDGMYEVKVKYNRSKEIIGVLIDFAVIE
jgi:hypothetical protein